MSGRQHSEATAPNTWAQDTLLALCFFLLGDKIVIVSTLLLQFWDWLTDDTSQDKYIAEASLLALGIGLAGATVLSVKFRHGRGQDSGAVIAGVCVGAVAGLLEVMKVLFIDNSFDAEEESRPLFMFAIYVFLFLGPAFSGLTRGQQQSSAVRRLSKMAVAVVIGFLAGVIVSVICRWLVIYLPVFPFAEGFTAAGDQFLFRPIALVWLCSVWCVATFLRSDEGSPSNERGSKVWMGVYVLFASLCALYYGAFEVAADDKRREAVDLPVWLGFVLIGVFPLFACLANGAAQGGLRGMRTLRACLWSFAVTVPVAYVGFGGVFGGTVLIKLSGALIYGFAGATIPLVAWLSARAYLQWFGDQQPEPT